MRRDFCMQVRDQIKDQFPHRPWLDVRSKADLPLADGIRLAQLPRGTLHVSVPDNTGIAELQRRMASLVQMSFDASIQPKVKQ